MISSFFGPAMPLIEATILCTRFFLSSSLNTLGVLELNKIPDNYFADVEQAAFAPAHVVDGISYSPDKMLQGRILSYPDAHRYRLGANYEQHVERVKSLQSVRLFSLINFIFT